MDDSLQIDLPADTFYHSLVYGFDTAAIRSLFITHSHYDHFAPGDLNWLAPGFVCRDGLEPLNIFANEDVIDKLKQTVLPGWAVRMEPVAPFQSTAVGEYLVTALPARHNIDRHPLNFLVRGKKGSFLYACDTGEYSDEVWDFLGAAGVDLVIVECTFGKVRQDSFSPHLGLPNVADWKKRAESIGFTNESTSWVLTHFSHIIGMTHDELVEVAAQHGILVGFDGMEFDL